MVAKALQRGSAERTEQSSSTEAIPKSQSIPRTLTVMTLREKDTVAAIVEAREKWVVLVIGAQHQTWVWSPNFYEQTVSALETAPLHWRHHGQLAPNSAHATVTATVEAHMSILYCPYRGALARQGTTVWVDVKQEHARHEARWARTTTVHCVRTSAPISFKSL